MAELHGGGTNYLQVLEPWDDPPSRGPSCVLSTQVKQYVQSRGLSAWWVIPCEVSEKTGKRCLGYIRDDMIHYRELANQDCEM